MAMRFFLVLIAVLAVTISCAAPYMTATDCSNFCHAEGKKVASYKVGAQIPIAQPRPRTDCQCDEGISAE